MRARPKPRLTPVSPTPVSPTPVSPTLDQKVVFRLLINKIIFGHPIDVKLHLEIGSSLKMYLRCQSDILCHICQSDILWDMGMGHLWLKWMVHL